MSVAPAVRTKSASRPSNDRTSTRGSNAAFWIRECHVVLAWVQPLGEAQRVRAMDRGAVVDLEGLHVRLEGGQREAVQLHEIYARGPPRQRFEAERPGAREQVEDPRPLDRALQDREPRLAHTVRGRPDRLPRGRLQTTTLELPGDDADHARPRPLPNAERGARNAEQQGAG